MSTTTALVRTPSSKSFTIQKPASPATTSPVVLPKLNLTPQSILTPSKTPSTPSSAPQPQQQPPPPPPSPAPSTPGPWQHPRTNDIILRQSATNFDKTNIRTITTNLLLLALSFVLPTLIPSTLSKSTRPYELYTLFPLRAVFLLNTFLALRPLLRKPDPCEDIPLTPAQRARLGLPPMTRPATPAEEAQYVTPPRYARSGTPRGSTGGSSVLAHASGSPVNARTTIDSPLSPFASVGGQRRRSSGSPLTPSGLGSRRASYGMRSSPIGSGGGNDSDFVGGGTPSKVLGNPRASVGLNSKWLYEKGRGSPTAAGGSGNAGGNGNSVGGTQQGGFMAGGWGTGSVFS